MKLTAILVSLMLSGLTAGAAQLSRTATTEGGDFALTNLISNQQFTPVAALLAYEQPVSGTVRVERISSSNTYLLAVRILTNTQTLVWTPDFLCGFANREVLRLAFPASTGTVQLLYERVPW